MSLIREENPKGLRVIETGRSLEEINQAAKSGFRPLVKKVEPSEEIKARYTIYQHKITGEIAAPVSPKAASYYYLNKDYIQVINRTFYYPYNYTSPFAAYLIPKDLTVGEKVYLDDLIEDLVACTWNGLTASRLKGCEAIWNGKDFEILYDESSVRRIMG